MKNPLMIALLVIGIVIGAAAGSGITTFVKPTKTVTKHVATYKKITSGMSVAEITKFMGHPSGVTSRSVNVTLPKNCVVYEGLKVHNSPTWYGFICPA